MTLQSSGAIAFGDINVELTIARATQLSLGGAAARGLAGVASGAIRLGADFYGKAFQTVNIGDYTGYTYDTNLEYAVASSSYQLLAGGTVYWAKQEGGLATDGYLSGEWLTAGPAAGVSALATIIGSSNSSGAAINGTFGSWISITGVQPHWDVNATAITNFGVVNESAYVSFTLELARTSNLSVILDSATITLRAEASAFT